MKTKLILSQTWRGRKSSISILPLLLVLSMLSCQLNVGPSEVAPDKEEVRDGILGKYYDDICTIGYPPKAITDSLVLRKDYTYSLKLYTECYPRRLRDSIVTETGRFELRDTSTCTRRSIFGDHQYFCGTIRFYPDGGSQWGSQFLFSRGSNRLSFQHSFWPWPFRQAADKYWAPSK